MADIFEDLLAAVGIKNEELKRTSDTIATAVGIQVQEQRLAEEQQAQADSKSREVKKAELLQAQEANNQTRKFAENLGTNPNESSEIMSSLAKDWRDAATDAATKNKELSRATSSKFLDDPIQFIKDQIFLESKTEEAKAANQRVAASQQALTFAQNQTQQAAVTQNALSKTVSDKTIQDTLDGMAAESAAKAHMQRVQNTGININGILNLQELSLKQLNNISTSFSAAMQMAHLEQSKKNLGLQQRSLELQIEERMERLQNAKEDRQELENTVELARKGAAVLGYSNVMGLPASKIIQMLKLKDPKVSDWVMAGMKSETIGYPVVSENAGEAARVIVSQGAPLRGEQDSIKRFLGSIWNEGVQSNPGAKPEQITIAVGKVASQSAANQMKNIKPGDASNIYAPPPLTAIVQVPAIKSSALFKNVFADQMSTGVLKEFQPDQLIAMTIAGIKAGKISINDASEGLQGMFNAARAINNTTKNYPGFGLPTQQGYNTEVGIGGFSRKYDMTQKQAIDQVINFNLSYKPQSVLPFMPPESAEAHRKLLYGEK